MVQEENGKKICLSKEDQTYLIDYRDEFFLNGISKIKVRNLGQKLSTLNAFFLDYLNAYNIPTGFKRLENRTLVFQKYTQYPFTIKVLNVMDRRTSRVFGRQEGELYVHPVFQFHFGNSRDNLISESHLIALDVCSVEELKAMKRICSKINAVMKPFFERRSSLLAEFNCSFGKDSEKIFIVDDFTPRGLKIVPAGTGNGRQKLNPYKLKNVNDFKNYLDFLLSLTNN